MSCCRTGILDRQFSIRVAERDLARYRRTGPDWTTRHIIDAVSATLTGEETLLDVGGGIGVIHHELLAAGVRTAFQVEPSSAYLEVARAEAERRGHADRVRFRQGELVPLADGLDAADVVTLDAVLCCDPDVEGMIGAATWLSRRIVAVSVPRDRWAVRFVHRMQNLARRIGRSAFRTFVHPETVIDGCFADAGFAKHPVARSIAWSVTLYARTNGRIDA